MQQHGPKLYSTHEISAVLACWATTRWRLWTPFTFLISCAKGSCSTAITPQNAFRVRLQCSVVKVVKRAYKHGRIAWNSKAENTEPRQGSHIRVPWYWDAIPTLCPPGERQIENGDLLRWMRADLPADFPSLASAVLKIQAPNPEQKPQLSIGTVSSWMDDEPHLKHCEADEQAGVHPYLAPFVLVSCVPHKRVTGTQTKPRCRLHDKKWLHHQTNQHLGSNWLSEARSGFSAAFKYLMETRPSSAEMLNPLSTGSTFQLTERHQPIYSSKCFCNRNGDDSFAEWLR